MLIPWRIGCEVVSARNFFMMVFMVVVFPLTIIFYNTDAFFLMVSLVLVFISVGSLNGLMAQDEGKYEREELETEEDEEAASEIGETLGLNVHKLGYGLVIAVDLIIVLYYLYTFLMIDWTFLKAVAVVLIADWLYDIIKVIDGMINVHNSEEDDSITWKDRLYELYLWTHNIVNIGFVITVVLLKFFG